jgi:hypothetical protein
MEEIVRGLRRWVAWHPEWRQDVGSLAVDTADGLVLVDPIDPPPEVRKPAHVLITVFWHSRSSGTLEAPHVWAAKRGLRRLKNRGTEVTDPFEVDDGVALPGGVQAFATAREGEVVYWLAQYRSLAVGDVLLGAGAKPHATSEPLRLCPERWLGDKKHRALKKSLQPLLDLPIERILVSHGDPVLKDGKEILAELIG